MSLRRVVPIALPVTLAILTGTTTVLPGGAFVFRGPVLVEGVLESRAREGARPAGSVESAADFEVTGSAVLRGRSDFDGYFETGPGATVDVSGADALASWGAGGSVAHGPGAELRFTDGGRGEVAAMQCAFVGSVLAETSMVAAAEGRSSGLSIVARLAVDGGGGGAPGAAGVTKGLSEGISGSVASDSTLSSEPSTTALLSG